VLLSASGKLFRQETARRYAKLGRIVLLCGRYEGVDERVADHLATEEVSIGDFVLSGGELAAALVMDAVTRLLPGALGNEAAAIQESFSPAEQPAISRQPSAAGNLGILDYPHYTRPQEFRGWAVPEILISGNHEQIRRWRRRRALEKTLRNRPDLVDEAALGEEDRSLLEKSRGKQ
jgi:tRNA (guanine37-N1)-methyltransferase